MEMDGWAVRQITPYKTDTWIDEEGYETTYKVLRFVVVFEHD
jgi:hypothetical protein